MEAIGIFPLPPEAFLIFTAEFVVVHQICLQVIPYNLYKIIYYQTQKDLPKTKSTQLFGDCVVKEVDSHNFDVTRKFPKRDKVLVHHSSQLVRWCQTDACPALGYQKTVGHTLTNCEDAPRIPMVLNSPLITLLYSKQVSGSTVLKRLPHRTMLDTW
jgi:hypothetical protein